MSKNMITTTHLFRYRATRYLLLFFLLILGAFSLQGQSGYKINGTIKDTEGSAVIGATVVIEGTTIGAAADISGSYAFTADLEPGAYLLNISAVGYSATSISLTLADNQNITIDATLEIDILGLQEVVITGTGGLTEKKQLGNSISKVEGVDIAASGAVDLTGSLVGKISGIQVMQNSGDPAGGVSVRLRSASTVNGTSDPLYIIDGVIVNNNSNDLLGVQSVQQNRLSDINPKDIERIEIIKGAAAAAIYGSRASNGVVQIFTKKGVSGKPRISYSSSVNFNSLRKKRPFNEAQLKWAIVGEETEAATRFDYQEMVFENSTGTDNYVSVTGGVDNTKYFTSLSYMYNEGIMVNTDYSRVAGRIRIDQRLNDWANFSMGSYISRSHSNDKPNGGYNYGVLQAILFTNNLVDPYPDEEGRYPQMAFFPNIFEVLDKFDFQQQNNRSISDFQINIAPLKGLTAKYILGYDNSQSTGTTFIPFGTNTEELDSGRASTRTVNTLLLNSDLNIVYDTKIGSFLKSTTALGATWQIDRTDQTGISGDGLALGVIGTNGAITIESNQYKTEWSIWGAYIQQTFGILDRIFLTGAARIDGSSVFGVNERNQFYPKASVSYVLSEEQFWKDYVARFVNNFKIRTAWGQAGNLTAIGPFDRLTNYFPVSMNGQTGLISPSQLGNTELKPERQTEKEFGIDMSLLNNRLGLEFTYYNQDIQDLLLNRTLAPSTGATSRIENIGRMTNVGYEILLTATAIQTKDFRWELTTTYSTNQNEVYGIEGDEIGIGNFGFSVAKNGYPLGVFKQGYYARNDDGSLLLTPDGFPQRERGQAFPGDVNVPERDGEGQPEGELLQKVIGDPNPDFIASLISELSYKNLTMRIQFDAVQGFDVLSWDTRMFNRFGGGKQEEIELLGEEPKGTGTKLFSIAESYIEDGSFTKLREVSLSYLLPDIINKEGDIRFTLSGRNLYSFDNFSGWDPEVNMDAQSNGSRGGIMGLIPIPRTIKFGVTVNF
jgi:TonB-linked SusC/RagA family outer membrane protein